MNEFFLSVAKRGDVRSAVVVESTTLLSKFVMVTGNKDVAEIFRLATGWAEARVKGVPDDAFATCDDPVPDQTDAGRAERERFGAK